ncbi:hypothetical protein [uncultured Pluralibacter sp.]|uniref:DUF1281 domain-containing protein n=1 Tax=uncultured Pluralibacter sp. TaxID=1490864 RepID=UPI00262B9BFA|nr:hypothetical protein [uncultured Pluralibacter sp.]
MSEVRTLMRGEVCPAYVRAESEGIQLFLAGCAGLLRPVTDKTCYRLQSLCLPGNT